MPQAKQRTEEATGRAVAALIFGIFGIVGWCPCIGSVVAIVLATGEKSGAGRAGLILGWIGLSLSALALVVIVIQFLLVGIAESF